MNCTETTAEKCINELQCVAEYLGWMNAITWAAAQAAKTGQTHQAQQLASAAQYLTMERQSWIEATIREMEAKA